MSRPVNHPDGSLIASYAANISWANTDDRTARTKNARDAFKDRFITEARARYGDLPDDELARRAEHLRKAHYKRLALKSAQARRKKGGGK